MAAIREQAASQARSLSRQQLEELCSLPSPPLRVRRALGLVYCILHPEAADHYGAAPEEVPWRRLVVPLLRRDGLTGELADFPPCARHPLAMHPAVAELLGRLVTPEPPAAGAAVPPGHGRRCGSATGGGGRLRGSPAARSTARLVLAEAPATFKGTSSGSLHLRRATSLPSLPSASHSAAVMGTPGFSGRQRTAAGAAAATGGQNDQVALTSAIVTFASQAASTFFHWAQLQLRYSEMLREARAPSAEAAAADLTHRRQAREQAAEELLEAEGEVEATEDVEAAAAAAATAAQKRVIDFSGREEHASEEVEELRRHLAAARRRMELSAAELAQPAPPPPSGEQPAAAEAQSSAPAAPAASAARRRGRASSTPVGAGGRAAVCACCPPWMSAKGIGCCCRGHAGPKCEA